MATATLLKMEHKELTLITRMPPHKEKTKRRKRKMSRRESQTGESSALNARVKRFHSKSRNGCMTCRQRRVKCDEQRSPHCSRCTKGGYICEWQDARPGRSRFAGPSHSSTSTRSTSRTTLLSDDDYIAQRFFSVEGGIAYDVSRLFIDMAESFIIDQAELKRTSECINNFYFQYVYQASLTSHIVQKTLSALAGLYDKIRNQEYSPARHEHLSRYNDAVATLRSTTTEVSPDVVLISSILLANCEYLMGDLCSAVRHLQSGAKILQDRRASSDGRLSPELCETLGVIFKAFDHETSIELDAATPGTDYFDTINEIQFDNLTEANQQLLQIYSHTFALRKVGQSRSRYIEPATQDFQRWSNSWKTRTTALESLLATDQLPWLHLLHGQHTVLNTVIDDMSNTFIEPMFDDGFDHLTFQISNFLQTQFSQYQSDGIRPFRENVGLILPLLTVTLRAYDADTCETALSLLAKLKTSEGVLNSCCAHAVGRAVVNARHATRFSHTSTDMLDDLLPIAEIRKVIPLNGTALDLTIDFPTAITESNAIVGDFCANPTNIDQVCAVLAGLGYQGAVLALPLLDCSCSEGL